MPFPFLANLAYRCDQCGSTLSCRGAVCDVCNGTEQREAAVNGGSVDVNLTFVEAEPVKHELTESERLMLTYYDA